MSSYQNRVESVSLFTVVLAERVEKATFMELLGKCKDAGGFYLQASKKASLAGGFAFTDEAQAKAFSKEIGGVKASTNGKVKSAKSKKAEKVS
jgi:hypothetical protein